MAQSGAPIPANHTDAARPANSTAPDHSTFDRLLNEHVTQDGLVDYDAFAGSPAFEDYLSTLDEIDVASLSRDDELALWINAYNAYTIALVNKHDERESIRNINRLLGVIAAKGPWTQPIARVGGAVYTLDEIEHDVIRSEFDEPRIHFALVCAAIGCPPLRREAYTGNRLDDQLDDQTRRFLLHSPEKNRVDVSSRTVYLSKIFDWYGDDFLGGTVDRPADRPAHLGDYLARYFPPGPERELLLGGSFEIAYTDYDWSLNAVP